MASSPAILGETNVPFGLDLEHDFIGKHRVVSHVDADERWWGIKYTEKGPPSPPWKSSPIGGRSATWSIVFGCPLTEFGQHWHRYRLPRWRERRG